MMQICESTTAPKASGARWLATLITPGKGSSGTYSEEMLRSMGPAAFPKGTHSYIGHSEDGVRNPRDLFAVLESDAYYEEGVGLVATLKVLPHFRDFADAVAEHTGLSIYAAAEKTQDPQSGEWVVEAILPAVDNAVDLVSYPGRGGQLAEKLLESARSSFDTSVKETDSGASRNHKEKEKILAESEIVDLASRVDTLAESVLALSNLVTPLAESIAAEQAKAAKEAEEAAKLEQAPELDYAAIAEAAIEAGLPPAARKVVYGQVRLGVATVEEAIAAQKEYVESVQQSVRETLGASVRVGTDSVQQDFEVSRWVVQI